MRKIGIFCIALCLYSATVFSTEPQSKVSAPESRAQGNPTYFVNENPKFDFNQHLAIFLRPYPSDLWDEKLTFMAMDKMMAAMKEKGYHFVAHHMDYHNVVGRIVAKKAINRGSETLITTLLELEFIESTRMAEWQPNPKKYVRKKIVIVDASGGLYVESDHSNAETVIDGLIQGIVERIPESKSESFDDVHCPFCGKEKETNKKVCSECDAKREHFSYLLDHDLPDTFYD